MPTYRTVSEAPLNLPNYFLSLPGPLGSAPGSFRGLLVTALKLAEPPNTFARLLGDPLSDSPNIKNLCFTLGFSGFCLWRLSPLGAPSGSLRPSPGMPVGLSWSSEVGRQLPELLFFRLGSPCQRPSLASLYRAKLQYQTHRPRGRS